MSNRAEKLLQASGIHESLIGSLERGDTIFVLTSGTLVYQDSSGTRRVTLRDLTRIHSDQDGMLRVETPAGTALTASLLGFDPVDVQTFFGQVRDTTARVKQAGIPPVVPPPAAPRASASVPSPAATPSAAPAGFQESVKVVGSASAASRDAFTPAPKEPTLIIPSPAAESRNPTLVTTPPVPARNPTQITPPAPSRSVAAPNDTVRTAAPVAPPMPRTPVPPAPPAAEVPTSSVQPRAETKPAEVKVAPKAPEPTLAELPVSAKEAEADLPANGKAARVPQSAAGTLAALAAHAESVRAWVGRMRFMSGLMLLAALALAYFQMQAGQGLTGIWVLIAGGMGAVSLWALADLTKLLVALASAVSAEGGVMDVD